MIKLGKILDTNKNLELDLKKLVNGRTFVSAMTDGGKSYTIRKIVEEVFGKTGIIILDPDGEYSSLREFEAPYSFTSTFISLARFKILSVEIARLANTYFEVPKRSSKTE